MSDAPTTKLRDPDIANADAALRRAALRAREEARHTTGYVVVFHDGKIVEERVDLQTE